MTIEVFKLKLSHTFIDVQFLGRDKPDEAPKMAADRVVNKFGFKSLGDK